MEKQFREPLKENNLSSMGLRDRMPPPPLLGQTLQAEGLLVSSAVHFFLCWCPSGISFLKGRKFLSSDPNAAFFFLSSWRWQCRYTRYVPHFYLSKKKIALFCKNQETLLPSHSYSSAEMSCCAAQITIQLLNQCGSWEI